jgi:hypothetical protein
MQVERWNSKKEPKEIARKKILAEIKNVFVSSINILRKETMELKSCQYKLPFFTEKQKEKKME